MLLYLKIISIRKIKNDKKWTDEKLAKEPKTWKYIERKEIPNEDALTYIKTSVIIDFEVIELFDIYANNAFEAEPIDNNIFEK